MVNRPVLIAVFGIGAIAFVNGVIAHKPITRIVLATYLLLVLLSIADIFGGAFSTLAGAIAILAFTYMLLTQTGDVWIALAAITRSRQQVPPPPTPGGGGGGNFK